MNRFIEILNEKLIKNSQLGRKSLEAVLEDIKQAEAEYKGGWIPCSERLPEKNGMYLCTQNSYDLATNKNILRVSTELVEFYNGKWRRAKNLVVTHWQPLPEPFKERDCMITYEDECCGCATPAYPCMGDACPCDTWRTLR